MALEDAAQHHETYDILHRANDAEKVVHLMSTMRHAEMTVA